MKEKSLTIPDVALIASTRAMAGVGIGLLLSDKLQREHRRAAGWTLVLVGAVTTIPLMMKVFGKRDQDLVGDLTGRRLETKAMG